MSKGYLAYTILPIEKSKIETNIKDIEDSENEKEFDHFIKEITKDGADPWKVMVDYVGEDEMKKARENLIDIS